MCGNSSNVCDVVEFWPRPHLAFFRRKKCTEKQKQKRLGEKEREKRGEKRKEKKGDPEFHGDRRKMPFGTVECNE